MATHTSDRKRSVRGKIMAILAGGAIIGLGTTATLAAWTDTEWVFGGNAAGNGPGLGTSNFEVEQNVTASPYNVDGFLQNETNPGQALTFGLDALSLELGQSVYAPVALRTVAGSGAGALTLQAAVAVDATVITANDTNDVLWNALQVRVWASATSFSCTAAPTGYGIVENATVRAGYEFFWSKSLNAFAEVSLLSTEHRLSASEQSLYENTRLSQVFNFGLKLEI